MDVCARPMEVLGENGGYENTHMLYMKIPSGKQTIYIVPLGDCLGIIWFPNMDLYCDCLGNIMQYFSSISNNNEGSDPPENGKKDNQRFGHKQT